MHALARAGGKDAVNRHIIPRVYAAVEMAARMLHFQIQPFATPDHAR